MYGVAMMLLCTNLFPTMTITEGHNLMQDFMAIHGLTKKGWTSIVNDNRSRLGYCDWRNKTIALSSFHILHSPDDAVLNTILHEIAHALVGPSKNPHGDIWRNKALEIGCTGERCGHMNAPKKFTGHCRNCGKECQTNRRTKVACSTCCKSYNNSRFNDKYLIIWK